MTFEYRDEHRQTLRINRLEPDYPGQRVAPAIWIETMDGAFGGTAVKVPLDHVEEVVAGIRDAARQAAGQPVCACGHPQGRHNTACANCPCVGFAQTWPRQAAERLATTARVGRCPVMLQGGGRCEKNADHRPPGSDDPHTPEPAVEQPAEAQPAAKALEALASDLSAARKLLLPADVRAAIAAHRAEILREGLTAAERQFLTFALDLAADRMTTVDGFTDEDEAALARFRRMADEETR